eukprot:Phypoly_transcript_00035.p1 GENE.Phypoly_transcript_00035~~Phypoly_transcript_00035.p1  ORF type:complete len:2948 (+),score=330.54 Phypoly_transcript_00035:176-8845(+)
MEEYIPAQPLLYTQPSSIAPSKYHTFIISAKSSKALLNTAKNLIEVVNSLRKDTSDEQEILYHLAGNLAVRRTHYAVRKFFAANSLDQLSNLLEEYISAADDARKESRLSSENIQHRVCFVFPGQGSQWLGCGSILYQTEPIFRSVVDTIDSYLYELSGRSVKALMLSPSLEEMDQCEVAQPLNFMIQVGIVELCRSVGIHPACIVGHSAGELAAAYASGAIPLKEMVRVVYERARLQSRLAGTGRMLVLPLTTQEIQDENEANPHLFKEVEISCYNAPNVNVVSGPESTLEKLQAHLKETRDAICQFVRGNIPFHSSKMESIKEDMLKSLSFLDNVSSAPRIPVISTVKAIVEGSFDKYYWWLNSRNAVQFERAVSYIHKHFDPTMFIEMSPHITMRSNFHVYAQFRGTKLAAYVPTLVRNEDDSKMWATTLGSIFEKGYDLQWRSLYPNPVHIKLPNYPFDNKVIINASLDESYARRHGAFGAGPLLGRAIWTHDKTFEVVVSSRHFPYLKEHVVTNVPVMPAACYIEMVLQAFNGEPVKFKDIQFLAAVPIISTPRLVQLRLSSAEGPLDPVDFKISSTTSKYDSTVPWILHCTGTVQRIAKKEEPKPEALPEIPSESFPLFVTGKEFYQLIPEEVYSYGPRFQVVQDVFMDKSKGKHCFSKIKLDDKHFATAQKAGYVIHPHMFDGTLQTFLSFGTQAITRAMEEFTFFGAPKSSSVRAEAMCNEGSDSSPGMFKNIDANLWNEDGSLIFSIRGFSAIVPPSPEGQNFKFGWQTKAENIPTEKVLATEITENPGEDALNANLSQNLVSQFRKSVLSFLEMEEGESHETVVKAISGKPLAQKEYLQYLWDASQQTWPSNEHDSPLLMDFARDLPAVLPSFTSATPITPQWVFAPFVQALKHIVRTVISLDDKRVKRVLEVSNSCNFSILPQFNDQAYPLEYFIASSAPEILTGISDQVHCDFPVRSLQADFEQKIPSDAVPNDGFFELIVVNMPTSLDSQEKCDAFLANYRQKLTPGGLLVLVGFNEVNDWLRCVGVDSRTALPLAALENYKNAHFNSCQVVPTQLPKNFPYVIYVLQADSNLLSVVSSPIRNIVFADMSGFYDTISTALPATGACVPYTQQAFNMDTLLKSGETLNILFFWCLQDKSEFCIDTWNALVKLSQACIQAAETLGEVNVWIVTQNAVSETSNIHGGTTWGLVRTLGRELLDLPKLRLQIVDIGAQEDLGLLPSLITSNCRENEMMIRNKELFVLRLFLLVPEIKDGSTNDKIIYLNPATEDKIAFRLEPPQNAQLDSMAFHTFTVPEVLEPNQVVVRVHYAAMNFRDLMVAQDRLPWTAYEKSFMGKNLGTDCSGVVLAVGESVSRLAPGDNVMCLTSGCFGNIVIVEQRTCCKVPPNIPMDIATLTGTYMTVYYSLIYLARLSRGMSCLVHGGMGGVGQATISVARHYGLEIYATAGTEEKREKLRQMGCKGVYDSRSFDWADQLLRDTQGNGVNAVLNSLHGTHIELGISVLAEGGWFCEIGKRDIYANSKIGLYALRKNITVTAIDSDRLLSTHPKIVREITYLVVDLMEAGKLAPIIIEEFPVSEYLAAFRHMQQSKHTGKLVFNLRDPKPVPVVDHRPFFDPKGVYLVTGGLGGMGLKLLQYLYRNGVRNLMLTDHDITRRRTVEFSREMGRLGSDANVVIGYADVSKYEDVENVVKSCGDKLKGVFHLAGNLDGASILHQNSALYQKAVGPKSLGALNLHKATQLHSPPLEHFVMTSSVSSAFGNSGQANYAAANAFLDALTRHRRAQGLSSTTFNMGAISDVGMIARDPNVKRLILRKGVTMVSSTSALAALDYQLRNDIPEMISVSINFDTKISSPWGYCTSGMMSKNALSETVTMSHSAVLNLLCKQVQKLTGASEVPPTQPLSSFGVDSMMGTELSIWIKDKFNVTIPAMRLMAAESCETLTQKILSNHTNSSSSLASATPNDLLAAFSQSQEESAPKPLVETEFMDTVQIESQFHVPMSTRQDFPAPKEFPVLPYDKGSSGNSRAPTDNSSVPTKNQNLPSALDSLSAPDSVEQVRKDIEDISNSFSEYVRTIGPPSLSPVHEPQNIFLTGATGFLGRLFLAHAISHVPQLKVTCIVRAENHALAMERIKKAMEEAKCWKDTYENNIVAIAGNLSQERLGQSEEDWERLCKTQHAVFHFAANLSMGESYSNIREDNTLVMVQVLRLCATHRIKPLHHISTLGIFPEYSAGFPSDMTNNVLTEDSESDLARLASPKELGYAWSKWAAEQILRSSQLAIIPSIIYRLPLTVAASDSGFASDVTMCLAIAAVQEGMISASSFPVNHSAVDTICDVIVHLAFNPKRKHNIYHIVSKETHSRTALWRWMNEVGFAVKFIHDRQILLDTSSKPTSPLRQILPVLNVLQVHDKRPIDGAIVKNGLPISTVNAEEDYKKVVWPRADLAYTASFLKMMKLGDNCEYPLPKLKIELEDLVQHVQSFTGLRNMGPNSFYESLARLIESLRNEAKLSDNGRIMVRQDIWRRLVNRQYLFKEIHSSPEILQVKIERPVFIIGLFGSGTTFLHRLMSEDRRFRAPLFFETACPVKPSVSEDTSETTHGYEGKGENDYSKASDPRLRKAYSQWQMKKLYIDSKIGLPLEEVDCPASDYSIFQHDIQCASWGVSCDVPSFNSWLLSQADMTGTYAFHKLFLQYLQHAGRNILSRGRAPYSWLLEFPMHMKFIENLFETYPDAVIIQMHRHPSDAISSWCPTVEKIRKAYSDNVDKATLGAMEFKTMQEMVESVQSFRLKHPELANRFIDVKYNDMLNNPIEAADKLYTQLKLELSPKVLHQHLSAHPDLVMKLQKWIFAVKEHSKTGSSLEEFGLSKEQIEDTFATYIHQFYL